MAGLGDAGDDFVEDEGHAMAVADAAQDAEVLGGRRNDSAGVADRLEDDAGDGLRAFVNDNVFDGLGGEAVGLVPRREPVAVVGRWEDLEEAGHLRVELGLAGAVAAGGHRAERSAVVAVIAADELALAGAAGLLEIL